MKYMEALRDAKRLTAVSGIKHDVFQREYVDSEGYTVTENYVSEVRPNAARAAGLSLEQARAHVADANQKRPMGLSWDAIEQMQGGRLKRNPRRSNPVPPSSKSLTAQIARAKNLFKRFTGHDSEYADKVRIPEYPDAVVCIGDVAGIMYNTVRDGKAEKYLHRFHASSRPLFCVSPDGSQLFLLGGAYDFTERGIVDTDPNTGRARE